MDLLYQFIRDLVVGRNGLLGFFTETNYGSRSALKDD